MGLERSGSALESLLRQPRSSNVNRSAWRNAPDTNDVSGRLSVGGSAPLHVSGPATTQKLAAVHFVGDIDLPSSVYRLFTATLEKTYDVVATDLYTERQKLLQQQLQQDNSSSCAPRHRLGLGFGSGVQEQQWMQIVEQLVEQVRERRRLAPHMQMIGIAHGSGAHVLQIASARNPRLFDNILLMQPPVIRKAVRAFNWLLSKSSKIGKFMPIGSKHAGNEPRVLEWDSKDDLVQYLLSSTDFFAGLHPSVQDEYINYFFPFDKALRIYTPLKQEHPTPWTENLGEWSLWKKMEESRALNHTPGVVLYSTIDDKWSRAGNVKHATKKMPNFKFVPIPQIFNYPLCSPLDAADTVLWWMRLEASKTDATRYGTEVVANDLRYPDLEPERPTPEPRPIAWQLNNAATVNQRMSIRLSSTANTLRFGNRFSGKEKRFSTFSVRPSPRHHFSLDERDERNSHHSTTIEV